MWLGKGCFPGGAAGAAVHKRPQVWYLSRSLSLPSRIGLSRTVSWAARCRLGLEQHALECSGPAAFALDESARCSYATASIMPGLVTRSFMYVRRCSLRMSSCTVQALLRLDSYDLQQTSMHNKVALQLRSEQDSPELVSSRDGLIRSSCT